MRATARDEQSTVDALARANTRRHAAEAQQLIEVARFARLNQAGHGQADPTPGAERPRRFGADGTPALWDFVAHELSPVLGIAPLTASNLVRDALDLEHRHPHTWGRVLEASQADAPGVDPALAARLPELWQLRKVAQACNAAGLTLEQARELDADVAPVLGRVPWSQFADILDARVIAADPASAEARRVEAAKEAYVGTARSTENGMKTVLAKVESKDAIAFLAMVDLVARCLADDGATEPMQVLRARAVGVLANPAEALALLLQHALEEDPVPVEDLVGERRVDHREPVMDVPTEAPVDIAPADLDAPPAEPDPDPTVPLAHLGGPRTLRRLIDLLGRRIDPSRLTPRRVLYLHLSGEAEHRRRHGLARFEGERPVTLEELQDLLVGSRVSVRPVIDLAGARSVHTYEIPDSLREAVELVNPFSSFPWSTAWSRGARVDRDHAERFDPAATHPQTRLDNLGPLERTSHRVKTHKPGWTVHQTRPGTRFWRTAYGYAFKVDHCGTRPLGQTTPERFAELAQEDRVIWEASRATGTAATLTLTRNLARRRLP